MRTVCSLRKSIFVRNLANIANIFHSSSFHRAPLCFPIFKILNLGAAIGLSRSFASRKVRDIFIARRVDYSKSQITKQRVFKQHPAFYGCVRFHIPVFESGVESVIRTINNGSFFQAQAIQRKAQLSLPKIHFGEHIPFSTMIYFDGVRIDHAIRVLKVGESHPYKGASGGFDWLSIFISLNKPKWWAISVQTQNCPFLGYQAKACCGLINSSFFRIGKLAGVFPRRIFEKDIGLKKMRYIRLLKCILDLNNLVVVSEYDPHRRESVAFLPWIENSVHSHLIWPFVYDLQYRAQIPINHFKCVGAIIPVKIQREFFVQNERVGNRLSASHPAGESNAKPVICEYDRRETVLQRTSLLVVREAPIWRECAFVRHLIEVYFRCHVAEGKIRRPAAGGQFRWLPYVIREKFISQCINSLLHPINLSWNVGDKIRNVLACHRCVLQDLLLLGGIQCSFSYLNANEVMCG